MHWLSGWKQALVVGVSIAAAAAIAALGPQWGWSSDGPKLIGPLLGQPEPKDKRAESEKSDTTEQAPTEKAAPAEKPAAEPSDASQPPASRSASPKSTASQSAAPQPVESKPGDDTPSAESNSSESKQQQQAVPPGQQESKSAAKSAIPQVGEPLAAGIVALLEDEMVAGLQKRNITDRFKRFVAYAGNRLDVSAARYTGSELAGNCRLRWYDHLLRNPLKATAEAEQFTRTLHLAVLDQQHSLRKVLAIAREKLDLPPSAAREEPPPQSPQEALDRVKQALIAARAAHAAALAPLTKSELRELATNAYPVLVSQNVVGHTLANRGTGRRLCDLIEKIDLGAMLQAAESLAPLASPDVLKELAQLPAEGELNVDGVSGTVAARYDTPAGTILIGGRGSNTYQLDKLTDVVCVIDLGGNDVYLDGSTSLARPVMLLIDLGGDDHYRGSAPGIQGGAILGVSMLLDYAGDDLYQAADCAQGSALAGVGILVDYAGHDRYAGIRRVQGQALGGVGVLIDRAGNDAYRAAMWAQGFGGPLGFGLLDDCDGADHYFCGGRWRDSYPETPGMEGWGQGVGSGLRQVANGGIGVILDGGGDDVYEFDYLAHGGGYWCGVGMARDFGGNDRRLITRTAFDGSQRPEPKFGRFNCGWGCHYSLGFLFDDSGDDVYEGTIMGLGMAWDCSVGALCDFGGNDRYEATGGLTQGVGAQMGLGILFDYNGDDVYLGTSQGYASPSVTYHPMPTCGGNFSFLADYGGNDKYGCGAKNNTYMMRGSEGGFLIDRPRREEIEHTVTKTPLSARAKQ